MYSGVKSKRCNPSATERCVEPSIKQFARGNVSVSGTLRRRPLPLYSDAHHYFSHFIQKIKKICKDLITITNTSCYLRPPDFIDLTSVLILPFHFNNIWTTVPNWPSRDLSFFKNICKMQTDMSYDVIDTAVATGAVGSGTDSLALRGGVDRCLDA